MDGKDYLLDTNIVIAFFSKEHAVVEKIDAVFNDIAKQHDLILVSRDKHFTQVEALSLESW